MNRADLWRFYGCENSYFSAKVRPALRSKRLSFAEILPTPAVYREAIRLRTGLAFIPVVVAPDGETLRDASSILDAPEERVPEPPLSRRLSSSNCTPGSR